MKKDGIDSSLGSSYSNFVLVQEYNMVPSGCLLTDCLTQFKRGGVRNSKVLNFLVTQIYNYHLQKISVTYKN